MTVKTELKTEKTMHNERHEITVDQDILSFFLDIGEIMIMAGAEISRVEDTIRHLAAAYHCTRADVFAITSMLTVTLHTREGEILTQLRRISTFETDMCRIEMCNALSRQLSRQPLEKAQLEQRIQEIRDRKRYPEYVILLGAYGGVSAVSSVFFGGSIRDAAAAFLCGLLLRVILRIGERIRLQRLVLVILCSAAVGLGAVLLTAAGLGQSVDKIIIGNIMLLIPGIAFTTSLRDLISGDLVSGMVGICEAILRAIATAVGFALVLWKFG